MPELLRIKTADFVFTIKATSIAKQRAQLKSTLTKKVGNKQSVALKLTPALTLEEPPRIFLDGACSVLSTHEVMLPSAEVNLLEPIFFENTTYQFDWIFRGQVDEAKLVHHSQAFSDAFIFTPLEDGITQARLTGTVNTGNHVGWMRLPLEYAMAGKKSYSQISCEILPTKMVLHQDLPIMYQDLDLAFPLWRFSLVEKTDQNAAKGKLRGNFPLLWLASFCSLREQLEQGLKVITQAPHSRLQPYVSYSKAARLKGRFPYRLAEKVKEDLASGLQDKRYRVEKKRLSIDTPENRFIKMVVSHSKKTLAEIEGKLRKNSQLEEQQRLSDTFLDELSSWQKPLQKILSQSFLKEVGSYQELHRASLVLQQKTGYSSVYRVWQELKFYLDVFASQASVSMKSVAEIYEVWCFLTLKNILEVDLGFGKPMQHKPKLKQSTLGELTLIDGDKGAFNFHRKQDGVRAKLYHEKVYSRSTKEIRTFLLTHKPDIVLEVILPDGQKYIWIFDAKYRIKNIRTSLSNSFLGNPSVEQVKAWDGASSIVKNELSYRIEDGVPDDAINQMHRYRDALIRINQESTFTAASKSRPVFGAFALYPGFFDQLNTENPYQHAINEIGIGAFALLPSSIGQGEQTNSGHYWLQEFLRQQIGGTSTLSRMNEMQEQLYVQEAARIPYHGMKQVLYPNLTMTASLGIRTDRDADYFKSFKECTAKYYHMPAATFEEKFKSHIAEEIQFLALSFTDDETYEFKSIRNVWPILSIQLISRNNINQEKTGKHSKIEDLYYLFELGKPLALPLVLKDVPLVSFKKSMKLTTLARLTDALSFGDIEEVYKEALVSEWPPKNT